MSQEDQASGSASDKPAGFVHQPVMVDSVVGLLGPVPDGLAVDATVGGGGHARAILHAHPQLRLLGIDRDPDALDAAAVALAEFGDRVVLRHARFDAVARIVDELARDGFGDGTISAALFDLGVSSPQFDRADRGFSYRTDAPLDMRMDRTQSRTAADIVNNASVTELADLFAANGEGKFAGRIARAIIDARPVSTTVQLSEVVRAAIPAATRRTGGHPAKRVFQALRIEVNDELDVLGPAIDSAIARLVPGGRLIVIAYHSGEDRLVKERFLAAESGGCSCPTGLPCTCGAVRTVRRINRGSRKPSAEEVAANPRAASARLRSIEKFV